MWMVLIGTALLVGVCADTWWSPPGHRGPSGVRRIALPAALATAWAVTILTPPPGPVASIAGTTGRLVVVTILILAARIDLATLRLPDRLTIPAGGLALAAATTQTLAPPHDLTPLFASLAFPTVLLTATLTIGGIGLGDVKLAVALGALLGLHGWGTVAVGFGLAWGSAALVGIVLVLRGAPRDTPIPLGPFLVGAAVPAPLLA